MSDALRTYLHDHLAGSNFAVELLETLREQHAGEPLAEFVGALQAEVEEDRQVLRELIERAGSEGSAVKDAAAWLGEKVSRWKLTRDSSGESGSFQALEALALGILGKLKLWQALGVLAPSDGRVSGTDYEALAERARAQHASVEERRLQMAAKALQPGAK